MSERLVARPAVAAVWGGLHVFSVGLAIGAATIVASLVGDAGAWPLGGFLATSIYLLGSATQLAVAHTRTSADTDAPTSASNGERPR